MVTPCDVSSMTVTVPGHCVMSASSLWLFKVTLSCLHQHCGCLGSHCHVSTITVSCSRSLCPVCTITVTVQDHTVMSAPTLTVQDHTVMSASTLWLFRITLLCRHHHCDCSRSRYHVCTITVTIQDHTVMSAPTLTVQDHTVMSAPSL